MLFHKSQFREVEGTLAVLAEKAVAPHLRAIFLGLPGPAAYANAISYVTLKNTPIRLYLYDFSFTEEETESQRVQMVC